MYSSLSVESLILRMWTAVGEGWRDEMCDRRVWRYEPEEVPGGVSRSGHGPSIPGVGESSGEEEYGSNPRSCSNRSNSPVVRTQSTSLVLYASE